MWTILPLLLACSQGGGPTPTGAGDSAEDQAASTETVGEDDRGDYWATGGTTDDDCPDAPCDGPLGCDEDCPTVEEVIERCGTAGQVPYAETCGDFELVSCAGDFVGYSWYFRDGQALCKVVYSDSEEFCGCTRSSYVLGDCEGARSEC